MKARVEPSAISLEDAAVAIARNHQLIDAEGWLHCWNCGITCDWHISLHCDPCRRATIDRLAALREVEANEHPETKRWRAIHRNMSEDKRLNRASALVLIKNSDVLRSATSDRMLELRRRFEDRFGKPAEKRDERRDEEFRRSGDD